MSEERARIYVCGPYSPMIHERNYCIGEAEENVRRAIRIGNELIEKGHFVFVPHLGHYQANAPNGRHDWPWYEIDNSFIEHWATALFYITSSKGSDAELHLAERLGLKIYIHLDEVPNITPARPHMHCVGCDQ